jgi:hypothetical protein
MASQDFHDPAEVARDISADHHGKIANSAPHSHSLLVRGTGFAAPLMQGHYLGAVAQGVSPLSRTEAHKAEATQDIPTATSAAAGGTATSTEAPA